MDKVPGKWRLKQDGKRKLKESKFNRKNSPKREDKSTAYLPLCSVSSHIHQRLQPFGAAIFQPPTWECCVSDLWQTACELFHFSRLGHLFSTTSLMPACLMWNSRAWGDNRSGGIREMCFSHRSWCCATRVTTSGTFAPYTRWRMSVLLLCSRRRVREMECRQRWENSRSLLMSPTRRDQASHP